MPRANDMIMQSIDDMEYISFSKTHLPFIRLIVVEMSPRKNVVVYLFFIFFFTYDFSLNEERMLTWYETSRRDDWLKPVRILLFGFERLGEPDLERLKERERLLLE